MPSIVNQIFHVTVTAGGFEATTSPPAVFSVTVNDGVYSVTYAADTFQVTLDEPSFAVAVEEATQYLVTWPIPGGRGIPGGGSAGQVLRKTTNASYDAGWTDETVTSVGGQVGDVVEIDPTYIGQAGAAEDQVLGWDGVKWTPIDQTGGGLADAPSDGLVYGRQDGAWVIVSGSGAVTSVNGATGAVVLDTDDITEGAGNLYFTEARANAASDVVANTAARHEHANKSELDLITDGDHDVRTDNPHGVTPAQISAAEAAHSHPLTDLQQSGATNGQVITWNDIAGEWQPFNLDDAPVSSVNGQTGAVVLDHTDVGAAPTSHSHVAADVTDFATEVGNQTDVAANTAHAALVSGNPHNVTLADVGAAAVSHSHVATDVTDFDTEVSNNATVVANTAARHEHANKTELDLVTDGDHDVRTDNPHGVSPSQIGAAEEVHTHDPSDLLQDGATSGQMLTWDGSTWAPADPARTVTTDAVYVDPAGSDVTGDGSEENPYATLQKGIDEAVAGETIICLGAADFAENVVCKNGVDIYAPNSTLTLNDGDQMTLAAMRTVVRRLVRTSGAGAMIVATNSTGYGILMAYEINDSGSGDTIENTNQAPMDVTFSQAYVGTGQSFLIDSSTGRHVHLKGEDIYLTAAGSTAITLSSGGTALVTVHHIKELDAGVGAARIFNIVDGDVNISAQEIGAATLADIGVSGNLNIVSQDATGAVNNAGGVYTYSYSNLGGSMQMGTNLGLFIEAAGYRLTGLAGNDGAFLTLGANGQLVPTTIDVGAVTWTDDTEAFTDVTATTEETVYELTVDQDVDAGNLAYELTITFPYYRSSTVRVYHEGVLLDTQNYTGSSSPTTFTGALPVDFTVVAGDTFTLTFQTDVAPAFEPNRTDITGGFLTVNKTGNEATASWGGITGTITDQTDLMNEFLSRTNTDVYTPADPYNPATKKYVDDNLPGPITADDVGGGTFPDTSGYAYTFPQNTVRFAAAGNIYFGTQNSDHTLYFYTGSWPTNAWMRWDESADGFAFSHDLVVNGTLTATDYAGVLPSHLGQAGATSGQVLAWTGASWEPQDAPGGAVDSVNGQTGIVVLDAADVGAAAAVHDHVATDVTDFDTEVSNNATVVANTAARHTHANKAQLDLITDGDHDVRTDNPHGITPVQIGAAPTSHVHGLDDITNTTLGTGDDLDTLTTPGWYNWANNVPANAPGGDAYKAMIVTEDAGQPIQMVFGGAGTQVIHLRRRDSGTWTAWSETSMVGHGHVVDDITDWASADLSINSLAATVRLAAPQIRITGTDLFLGYDATDGDRTIYFSEGGSNTGRRLRWDDSENLFDLNDSLVVSGSFEASANTNVGGNLSVDGTLRMNADGPDGDSFIYFYEGGSAFGAWLKWDNGLTRHEFSSSVYAAGSIRAANDVIAEDDIVAVGNIQAQANLQTRGNVYVNQNGPDGDGTIYFYEGGTDTGAYLRWDDIAARFNFNKAISADGALYADGSMFVNHAGRLTYSNLYFYGAGSSAGRYLRYDTNNNRFVLNDQLIATGSLLTNGDVYINRDADGDGFLYFRDGGSATGAHLKWDDASNRFEFDHNLFVSGNIRVDSGSSNRPLTLVSTDAQVGMFFSDSFREGEIEWDGPNDRFLFYDDSDTVVCIIKDNAFATSGQATIGGDLIVNGDATFADRVAIYDNPTINSNTLIDTNWTMAMAANSEYTFEMKVFAVEVSGIDPTINISIPSGAAIYYNIDGETTGRFGGVDVTLDGSGLKVYHLTGHVTVGATAGDLMVQVKRSSTSTNNPVLRGTMEMTKCQ